MVKWNYKNQYSKKFSIYIYISHPELNVGKCVNQKYVFWGHWKGIDDINYNITYLCHETLHILLPNKDYMPMAMGLYYNKDDKVSAQDHWNTLNSIIADYYKIFDFEFDVIHTVIELISDNELYTILSETSKYNEGHDSSVYSLATYKSLILPYWFEYLNLSPLEKKERKPNFISINHLSLKAVDKLNINNFIRFLINNQYIRSKLEIQNLVYKNVIKNSEINSNVKSL